MAAKDRNISIIKERLVCAICFNIYQLPKTFPCFHSFCAECISKLPPKTCLKKVGYECPSCRQFAPKGEVKSNFFVKDLTNLVHNLDEGDKTCTQCSEQANPPWRCLDCKIYLCENCQSGHVKIPVCRGHKVQPDREDTRSNPQLILDKVVFCTKHPDEIVKFHCKTCESPICIKCKVLKHDSHKAETIEAGVQKIVNKLRTWKDGIDEDIAVKKLEKEFLEIEADQLEKVYDGVRQQVKQYQKSVIEKVKHATNMLTQKLTAKESKERAMLCSWKDDNENELKKIQARQDYLSIMLDMSQGVSLMKAFYSDLELHDKNVDYSLSASQGETRNYTWEIPNFSASNTDAIQSIVPMITFSDKKVPTVNVKSHSKKVKSDDKAASEPESLVLISPNLLEKSTLTKTLDIPSCEKIPYKFALILSNIYVVDTEGNKIIVLNMQGDHIRDITELQSPTSVVHEEGYTIIISSKCRLELYDTVTMAKCTICKGNFRDVAFEVRHIVAYAQGPDAVFVFKKQGKNDYGLSIKIHPFKGNVQRILMKSGLIYLHMPDHHQVSVYNLDGKEEMKITTNSPKHTPNKAAKLCMVDEKQSMIFADWYYGLLELHTTTENTERMITLSNFPAANDVILWKNELFVLASRQIRKLTLGTQ